MPEVPDSVSAAARRLGFPDWLIARLPEAKVAFIASLIDGGFTDEMVKQQLVAAQFQTAPVHGIFDSPYDALGPGARFEEDGGSPDDYYDYHGYTTVQYWRDATGKKWTMFQHEDTRKWVLHESSGM